MKYILNITLTLSIFQCSTPMKIIGNLPFWPKVRFAIFSTEKRKRTKKTRFSFLLLSPTFAQNLINGPHAFSIPSDTIYKIEELLYKVNLLKTKQLKTRNDLLNAALLLIIQHLFISKISILDENLSDNFTWTQNLLDIMQNPNFPSYTVKDLCEKLGYSRMQLNRLFKIHIP